jgi:hypothetical protein
MSRGGSGRRRRSREAASPIDVTSILGRKVTMGQGANQTRMHPYEAFLRAQVAKAIRGNMRAAKKFILLCQDAGLFKVPEESECQGLVLRVPKDWDWDEWLEMYDRLGPPPWPGERDGLAKEEPWTPTRTTMTRSRGSQRTE